MVKKRGIHVQPFEAGSWVRATLRGMPFFVENPNSKTVRSVYSCEMFSVVDVPSPSEGFHGGPDGRPPSPHVGLTPGPDSRAHAAFGDGRCALALRVSPITKYQWTGDPRTYQPPSASLATRAPPQLWL